MVARVPTWCLQPSLLWDPPFRAELAEGIESYFKINAKSASSRAVEWDGHKVVIRGLCMSASGGVRRTLITELHGVEERLWEAERRVEGGGGDMKEVTELKTQWTETDARLRKFYYRHYTARMHAEGDRSSILLSWLVKGEQQHSTINAIRLDTGGIVNTQREINEAFRQYYATLYKADPLSEEQLREFLQTSQLTCLMEAQLLDLEKPIVMDEIQ
ncbi:hypothetical protein NDU88_000344 [Pleurodeles waltl]|uniref:Uncharacterized protein n=1 Tax=Pleurodeles waltl TaxID=8319 RepID=A0AAV7VY46_PLEWA|nr:hypothetical protein NDU88_000344 [Pleurodeles waltl]